MIVCCCKAVTDRDIRACAASGATTLREVARRSRAATGCGGCRPTVRALLEQACSESAAASTRAAQTPALGAR